MNDKEQSQPAKNDANGWIVPEINNYLQHGGLFNPEMMEHDKVRDLLVRIRNHFSPPQDKTDEEVAFENWFSLQSNTKHLTDTEKDLIRRAWYARGHFEKERVTNETQKENLV